IIAAIFFPLDFVGLFIALHAARNTQMKSSIHAPVVPAGAPRDAETKKYRITVLGPFPKPESLEMASGSTVKDIVHEMRRRHLIADLSRVKHDIIFPSYKFGSLSLTDKLQDVRNCFPGTRPDVCPSHEPQATKRIRKHESGPSIWDWDSDNDFEERNSEPQVDPEATESPWFPWPDKETCVLDILRHIPRCSFSKKQNTAIHWAMLALGLKDLPSDRFYIHEPTLLSNGVICMPIRWFKRGGKTFARAWKMRENADTDLNSGWVIEGDTEFELCESDLVVSFPLLVQSFLNRIQCNGKLAKWTKTNPSEGNRWRKLSAGHRVLAFPVWLYCDDTSGNTSKKWNKHNSFLFTAAGLPRKFVHRESNIHFLSTSNVAPPLEMLDGIVEQLEWRPEEENEDDAGSDASSVSSTASEQLGKKKKKTKRKMNL
ncbi:hypothetical protein B0H19DRAFT_1198996, partial [Mycena capillaripes]